MAYIMLGIPRHQPDIKPSDFMFSCFPTSTRHQGIDFMYTWLYKVVEHLAYFMLGISRQQPDIKPLQFTRTHDIHEMQVSVDVTCIFRCLVFLPRHQARHQALHFMFSRQASPTSSPTSRSASSPASRSSPGRGRGGRVIRAEG